MKIQHFALWFAVGLALGCAIDFIRIKVQSAVLISETEAVLNGTHRK